MKYVFDPPEGSPPGRSDVATSAAGAAVFSLGLGIASIAVPLLAVRAGYSVPQVGVLVALSAVGQMGTRLCMGALMRRLPDKVFIGLSGLFLATSCLMIVLSTAWPVFALSQAFQGIARAFFWTGTQTHAVRVSTSAVRALARVNLASGVGQLTGPIVAGLLSERSVELALVVATVVSALTVVPAVLLLRLPPFVPLADERVPGRIWRRPGVATGCWAGATAGAWRGLLGSYVPVLLEQARQSPSVIGVLVSTANAASVAGGTLAGRATPGLLRRYLVLGILGSGLGLTAAALFASSVPLAAAALAVSGLGAGVLQTVGPAVATDAVHPEERGEAIASAGTFRAAALFVAPFGVAGLVAGLPLAAALAAAGLLITAPALTVGRRGTGAAG